MPSHPIEKSKRNRKTKYSKAANNRTPGANNEYTGGPGGPGTGFCGPGGGLVVINVVASHYVY